MRLKAAVCQMKRLKQTRELAVPVGPTPRLPPAYHTPAVATVSVYAPAARAEPRASVTQYSQTWRRIYSPSGFLVSLLPGVTALLGMDASSSLSNYPTRKTNLKKKKKKLKKRLK